MKNKTWFEVKASGASAEISIYDEIGGWGVSAKDFMYSLKEVGAVTDITLRINSPGGSVFDGMAIYNQLKAHKAQVTVYIDGLAASMASVIAMAGDLIVMPENAMMMIHNPWMMTGGDSEELRKNADLLDKIKSAMLGAYATRTGKTEDEISAIMDAETWFTGKEAVENGFADESLQPLDIAASIRGFDLTQFKNSPVKNIQNPSAVADNNPKEVTMTIENKATSTVDNKKEIDLAVSAALAKEDARKGEIKTAFGSFSQDHSELLSECLMDQKVTVAQAQAKLLNAMGEKAKPTGTVYAVDDQAKGAINAMGEALASRVGLKSGDLSNNPFRGSSLLDMAGQCLAKRGVSTIGMDKMSIVASAFTHSSGDFGNLLSNTANKSMLKGYEEVEETFEQFTSVGSLPDFKSMSRVDINHAPSLRQVREGAEFKSVTFGDRAETVQLATYGELFAITRQAIINDDLGAFTRIPQRMGRAARRTVGDLVFAILTGNQTMSDGVGLFHADHNNLKTGSALTGANFDAVRTLMGLQRDASGNANLNIRPSFLLVPRSLESTAKILMASETDVSKSNSRVPNPVAGAATVISDSRLDAVSVTDWYALASASMHDVIEVQYLDGNSTPYLEQKQGWDVDGVEFKVRIDAGAKALDYRTQAKGEA